MNTIVFAFHDRSYTWTELIVGVAILVACILFLIALRYILASNNEARYGVKQENMDWCPPVIKQPIPIYVPSEDPAAHPWWKELR